MIAENFQPKVTHAAALAAMTASLLMSACVGRYCVSPGGTRVARHPSGHRTDGLRDTVRKNHRGSNAHDGCHPGQWNCADVLQGQRHSRACAEL